MTAGKHLVIMAAGTGGHVIPGLAVAREMQQRGWSVSWLGTRAGMENKLVPPSGIPMDRIGFSGLRGKGLVHTLTGGLRLLVVGGSLGAKALNDCVPQALALLDSAERPQVTHQTGQANYAAVQSAYDAARVAAEVLPFIDDMAQRLADCDVIVCRAGAVTVSELCAAGVAGVLVPLVVSTTSHQRDNAEWLAKHGAGIHLPQSELTPRKLADLLASLTRDALKQMAVKARELAKPRAAARVADELERLVLA